MKKLKGDLVEAYLEEVVEVEPLVEIGLQIDWRPHYQLEEAGQPPPQRGSQPPPWLLLGSDMLLEGPLPYCNLQQE